MPASARRAIDIGTYADGAAHTVRFQYDYTGSAEDGDTFIDDVTIDPTSTPVVAGIGHAARQPAIMLYKRAR